VGKITCDGLEIVHANQPVQLLAYIQSRIFIHEWIADLVLRIRQQNIYLFRTLGDSL
jgi:hypothetical protein